MAGINTAIASRTGAFSGIGFAIPSNQAKLVYNSLKSSGRVARGWLGVSIQDVAQDPALAESFGFKGTKGVLVGEVMPNTPATNKLRAGVVWANTFNRFDPASPFGGYKESGFGREGGRHGLEAYLDV